MTDLMERYDNSVEMGSNPDVVRMPAMMSTEAAREIGEIQGAIIVAQKCPRDEQRSYRQIITACKRKGLAESATYCFPRGNAVVKGPSIRLAEVMARLWGNLQYGVRELVRNEDETLFEAYCWDIQTNTRVSRRFSQRHWRDTKKGGYKLTDERDIYEAVANSAARRLRACILEIIPGDIVEDALNQCNRTKLGQSDMPLEDRIRAMAVKFSEIGVTEDMIEKKLGHKLSESSVEELADMKDIYTSLKDGVSRREDWFKTTEVKSDDESLNELNRTITEPKEKKNGQSRAKKSAKTTEDAQGGDEPISRQA